METHEKDLREIGSTKLGLVYFPEAPFKSVFGPKEMQDHLAYTSSLPLPLPALPDVLEGTTSVSKEDEEKIRNSFTILETVLKGYRDNVVKTVMELFDLSATQVLNSKNDVKIYL